MDIIVVFIIGVVIIDLITWVISLQREVWRLNRVLRNHAEWVLHLEDRLNDMK